MLYFSIMLLFKSDFKLLIDKPDLFVLCISKLNLFGGTYHMCQL